MKNVRRILFAFLAVLMFLSSVPPMAFATETEYGFADADYSHYVEVAADVELAVADSITNIFPDRFLAHIVAEHLEVSVEAVVTQATLDSIQSLSTNSHWQIRNLQGMQLLRNLTWIDFSFQRINDLQPLSGLTKLTHLNLWSNHVSDLRPLVELSNLTWLNLGHNNIMDISPLTGLSNLLSLNLSGQSNGAGGDNFVSWASSLTISATHIRDVNGNLIPPTFISNNGTYWDGTITWNNLPPPRVRARRDFSAFYEWNQPVQIGNASTQFSGRRAIRFLPFRDVTQNDWFCHYVWAATYNGWIIGTSETMFSPNAPLTRAGAVTILYRMTGERPLFQPVFNDVTADRWYSDAVTWAYQRGVVKGVGGGRFAPNDPVTREQLATMMLRAAPLVVGDAVIPDNIVVPEFESSPWAYEAMRLAAVFDFIPVEAPTSPASRAESIALIVRFINQFFMG